MATLGSEVVRIHRREGAGLIWAARIISARPWRCRNRKGPAASPQTRRLCPGRASELLTENVEELLFVFWSRGRPSKFRSVD